MKKCHENSTQTNQLKRALAVQLKVARAGFDWPSWHGALEKVKEEVKEVNEELLAVSIDKQKVDEELGDLLFAVINVVRHNGSCPEQILKAATDKFEARYSHTAQYVAKLGLTMDEATDEQMEAGWQYAKHQAMNN